MIKKIFIILVITLLTEHSKVLGSDHLIYDDEEADKSHQGTHQTIHTVKGHYNEEAKRISKCEENKPLTKKSNSKPTTLAQYDSGANKMNVNSNFNNTHDVHDIEMKVLAEILKGSEPNSRRFNDEKEKSQVTTNTNDDNNQYVVDKTNKQFEFESLLIKNVAKNEKQENNEDAQNNNRRFNPYQVNEAEPPKHYYDPFQNPPPRSYTPSDLFNPKVNQRILQGYNVQYNSPHPTLKYEKETTTQYPNYESTTSVVDVTSGHKKAKFDEDDDIFSILDKNISSADVKSRSDPTKGSGISDMVRSNVMLINHPRVCYACTSTSDPTCWKPDKRTPTKYCRKDHNACIAKTYIHKGFAFVIRDCGNSCSQRGLADLGIHYRSCTICHYDLCNAADSVRNYAINIIIMLTVLSFFKIIG